MNPNIATWLTTLIAVIVVVGFCVINELIDLFLEKAKKVLEGKDNGIERSK